MHGLSRLHAPRASVEGIASREDRGACAAMHGAAVGGHERHAPVLPIEDHLVVAHVGRADDGAIVLVVEDAKAPHTPAQLIRVLPWSKVDLHAVAHVDGEFGKLVGFRWAPF